jgi:predicted ATPase
MLDINLVNFRSFKDQDFNFSKINILIGENSSGKSSIFKFLLALKQSYLTPNSRESNFSFNGEYADLGGYKEAIYYQDDSLPMEFSFTFDSEYNDFFENFFIVELDTERQKKTELKKIRTLLSGPILDKTKIRYSINKSLDKHETIDSEFRNDSIGFLKIIHNEIDYNKKRLYGAECNIVFEDFKRKRKIKLNNLNYEKEGIASLVTGNSLNRSIKMAFSFDENDKNDEDYKIKKALFETTFYKIAYLLLTQNYLKEFSERLDYLNPINTYPSRVYLLKDDKQNKSINDIEDVVEFFSRNNDISKAAFKDFIQVLKSFGLADDIEIIKDDRLPVRELRVKIQDLFSNIKDVGYGVSLQMPIILKALLSERLLPYKNSILLIEQPEVHLHPKLHAKLIETFLKLSKNTTYFIETHSEHVIRKLQVLVKEGKVNPGDISIHYMKRGKTSSEVSTHIIQKNGMLEPKFPSGFFDNSYNLSKELLS